MDKTQQIEFMRNISKKSKMKQKDAVMLIDEINTRISENFMKQR